MHQHSRVFGVVLGTVVVAALLWAGTAAEAQDDGLRLSRTDFDTVNLKDPVGSFEQALRTELDEWRLDFVLTDPLASGRSALVHTVSAESVGLRWNGWDTGVRTDADQVDDLIGFTYRLAWVRKTARRWGTTTFASLGMYSDFENTGIDDLALQGGFTFDRDLGRTAKVRRQSLGVGAGYLAVLGEPSLLPVVRYYRQTRGTRVEILLPETADVRLTGNRWHLGFRARLRGNTYRISEDRLPTPGIGLKEDDEVEYSTGTAGLRIEWRIGRAMRLFGEFGSTFRQVLRVKTAAGEEVLDLDEGEYTTLGIAFGS